MAEVLTVTYDSNLTFNSVYSYLGVYNNKVYISTETAIYEFDVYNKIITTLYDKATIQGGRFVGGGIYEGVIYIVRGYRGAFSSSLTAFIDSFNIDTGVYSAGIKAFTQSCGYLCKPWVVNNIIYASASVFMGYRTNIQQSEFLSFDMSTLTINNVLLKSESCAYINEQIVDGYFQYSSIGYYSSYSGKFYVTQRAYKLGMMRMINNSSSVVNSNVIYQYTDSGTSVHTLSSSLLASGKFIKDNLLYMVGGTDESKNYINTIRVFDINKNIFSEIGNIKYNFYGRDVCAFNNSYYVLTNDGLITISFVDYNLTFDIKSNNGEKQYISTTGNSPITAVTFNNVVGSSSVGYVFETLSDEIRGNFEVDAITNKILSGFSTIINASSIQFPLNQRVEINISDDVTFYAVYSTYRPPATTFGINLYKNRAEANRVDKTDYLTGVGTINGALREESSITKPVITFESLDIPVFNYVFIPTFNRYYFVNDITSIRYKLWQISLSIDPLMTYRNAIMSCVGFIDRNEHEFNAGIIDKKRAIEQGRTMEVDSVTNELFTGVEGTFSLCALNATAVNVE